LLGFVCGVVKDSHAIVVLTPQNWDEIVLDTNFDVIVEFYSPYCSYCQELEPIWNELGETFRHEDSVLVAKIDASVRENAIPGHPIRGVPTIKLFPANKKDQPIVFQEHRTLTNFVEFIMANVGHPINIPLHYKSQPIVDDEGAAVRELVGLNFKRIAEDPAKDVIVNFYAPWCPWSQRLAPVWQQLGDRLKGAASVIVARFDGTANEVAGLHLHAYPTIALYRAVDNEIRYYREGQRTVEALTNFLKENAAISFINPETGELFIPSQIPQTKDHAVDVLELTDDTYENEVYRSDKNVLVLFYAPWCEHSQEMFETWEKVALEYKNIDSVRVAQMDASKAQKPGISIFPTVKLFPAGTSNKEEFPLGVTCKGKEMSVKNLAAFVAENAKRTPQEEILKRTGPTQEQWAQHNTGGDELLGQTLILAKEEL